MPDTTTDRFAERQEEIVRRRTEAFALYPALWKNVIAEWNAPDPQDRVWLTYSANYIFHTNHVHWAIDPVTLYWMQKTPPGVDLEKDLCPLSFVLLTHAHKDHLDLDLLSALRRLPITWVVPEFILPEVAGQSGLPGDRIIIPTPLNSIVLDGIRILPFDGLHWETGPDGAPRGVPSMGYRIECNGRRWLFPGDTRTYDAARLPAFPGLDVVFAHLWLGRGSALDDPPPLLDAFCRFHLQTGARRVILTHLHELGRDGNDYWDQTHAGRVRARFRELSADLPVSDLMMGESARL